MKKVLLGLAIMALGICGCSDDDEVRTMNTGKKITFSTYTEIHTRAGEVTSTNLSKFSAVALAKFDASTYATYFTEQDFSKNDAGNFVSTADFFWPSYDLEFCAYTKPVATGTDATLSADFQTSSNPITRVLNVKPATDMAKQEDLVAAFTTALASTDYTDGVCPLTFSHYLTEVIIKAKISNSQYKVKVKGVKIARMAGDGKYTFDNNTMVATSDKVNKATSTSYSTTYSTAIELSTEAQNVMNEAKDGCAFLIPQSVKPWNQSDSQELTNKSFGTYLALYVQMSTNGGTCKIFPFNGLDSDYAWMAVPVSSAEFNFQQGKKYTFILNFFGAEGAGFVDPESTDNPTPGHGNPIVKQGKKIQFSATVDAWGNEETTINL